MRWHIECQTLVQLYRRQAVVQRLALALSSLPPPPQDSPKIRKITAFNSVIHARI